ncbi:MAG: IPT/TIG domain-containing protein, partial [Xanthobacteraceae bacterium]
MSAVLNFCIRKGWRQRQACLAAGVVLDTAYAWLCRQVRGRASDPLADYSGPALARGMTGGLRLVRIAGLIAVALPAMIGAGGQAFAASPPVVTSVSTNPFSPSGGQTVTINGSNFTGATSVTIGGQPATHVVVNILGTSLTATTPADSVTSPSPTVSSISPNNGPTSGGTFVTITGTNFAQAVDVVVTTPAGNSGSSGAGLFIYNDVTAVTVGGTAATSLTILSPTQITVNTPPGVAGVTDVIVTTTSGNSGNSGVNRYAYTPGGPSVSSIGPTFGLTTGGNQVTITGSNFVPGTFQGSTAPATTVTIGGTAATNVVLTPGNTTTLTATVPAGTAGYADVQVSTPAGTTDAGKIYLYIAPVTPVVASISPNSGTTAGGTKVTISGSYFTGATQVTIGGVAVTNFTVNSPGSISATTAPNTCANNATCAVDVAVTVPPASPQTGTGTGLFSYITPPPS